MGRNKRERRELSAEEREQAQELMEKYKELAEEVARRYYHEHELGDQSWGGFDYGDILGVANEGLCDAVLDYVEQHMLPKSREKSYQAMSVELSEERERAYLKRSIENAITNYVLYEDRIHTAKEQVEQSGMVQVAKKPRFSTLKVSDDDNGTDCADTATEADFALVERKVDADQEPMVKLREFAETLPAQEQAAFLEVLKDAKNGHNRTPKEIARVLHVSERYYHVLLSCIKEHFLKWHLKEYYDWAA